MSPGSPRPPRAAVRAAVRAGLADLGPGSHVVVGLSGGPDSLALCSATARVGQAAGLVVIAAVVDHQLQPGSREVAQRAVAQAGILGCDHAVLIPVSVPRGPRAPGPEAAARDARRAALVHVAREEGAPAILLGHTLDDQAETVLLGLARGSGTRSLAGMAAVAGEFRRPLLGLRRATVAAAAAADARDDPRLAPWTDPHNADPRFLRSAVRRDLLPALTRVLGDRAIQGLARTAELARADADLLDALADARHRELLSQPLPGPPARPTIPAVLPRSLAGDAPALRTRVIRIHLRAAGLPPLSLGHVRALDEVLCAPPGRARVALPGGWVAHGVPAGLALTQRPAPDQV